MGFAHPPLYRHLSALFSRPYGEVGSLLADPSLEAVFGWTPDPRTLGDLAGSLLAEPLVKALDESPDPEGERCPERTAEARRRNHPY